VPFLFEDCTVDTDRREIHRRAGLVSAGPQVFDLLVYLIRNRHRVVGKDELLEAVWGGRTVSESTLTSHINAVRKAVGDSGSEQRLVRTLPRKGFRFVGEAHEEPACLASVVAAPSATPPAMMGALALPDRPSIAVLPFTNMSDDPTRDYFADGITEDIITELSRIRWLFVIARNSTFIYKGRAVDVKKVCDEMGVRYALEGSVRQAGDRVRITTQLIDAATGAHLWADRFDGLLEDIFDLQDRVATRIIVAISPKLERAEGERARRKPTENLNAYDCYLRGMASFYCYAMIPNSEALRFFRQAIELDPDFAAAYGMAAQCYNQRHGNRWMADPSHEIAEATRLARRAIELGRDDAEALCNGGSVLDYLAQDPEAGVVFIDRARTLNPNLAAAWLSSGWARVHLGNAEIAIAHFAHVMRLSPLDPMMFLMQTGTAFAHFIAGRNDEAASWADRAWREKPNWVPTLRVAAASHALAGRLGPAQKAMARLRELDPALRISNNKNVARFARPEDLARFEEGLRQAGLPE
jgi:TolB-like protein